MGYEVTKAGRYNMCW